MHSTLTGPVTTAFVTCAIGGGLYFASVLYRRSDLDLARTELKQVQTRVEDLQSRKAALYSEIWAQKEKIDSATAFDRKKSAIGAEIAALEKVFSSVRSEIVEAVRDVRRKASGEMIPELRLTDGQVLKNVKIQNITDYDMVASHDLGLARITLSRLPDPYKDRFRTGMSPDFASEPAPVPLDPGATPRASTAYVPEPLPAPVEIEVEKPPLRSMQPMPPTVPAAHSREQNLLTTYKKNIKILKERIAILEAAEKRDEQKGLDSVELDRPERFSNDPEQRARQIEQEEKRLADLARSAEATSNRRQFEIDELQEKILKWEAEIAKLEANRY
jgi:hypothetical protein